MARLTRTAVAKALVAEGFPADIELVRGREGYFYFAGGDCSGWYTTSVYTFHLNDLTLEQWVEEAKTLRDCRY